jgi:hypothetical protein
VIRPIRIASLVVLGACASTTTAPASNAELVRDLVHIRPWDGYTGFATADGRVSYGWESRRVLVAIGPSAEPALPVLSEGALQTDDETYRQVCRKAIRQIVADTH